LSKTAWQGTLNVTRVASIMFTSLVLAVSCESGSTHSMPRPSDHVGSTTPAGGSQISQVGQWYFPDGRPAPIGNPLVLRVERGPAHCGWQNTLFLWIAWPLDRPVPGQFMGDSRTRVYAWQTTPGYPQSSLAAKPMVVPRLPKGLHDSGLHRGPWDLWVPSAPPPDAIYLTDGETVERWAFATQNPACA
jgi:hypothetical protein